MVLFIKGFIVGTDRELSWPGSMLVEFNSGRCYGWLALAFGMDIKAFMMDGTLASVMA